MKRTLLAILAVLPLLFSCTKEAVDNSISIDGTTEYELNAMAVSFTVKVKCSTDWTFSIPEDATWIQKQSVSASAATFFAAENKVAQAREAVITFTSSAGSKATVNVKQKAAIVDPYINIDPAGPFEVESSDTTLVITVTTDQSEWKAESEASWITFRQETGKLNVDIQANTIEEERSATVVLSAIKSGETMAKTTFSVKQKELVKEYDPVNLSESGTSNCYLITHRGQYSFNATVKGNGKSSEGLSAPEKLSPAGAKLVWQSVKGMIQNVSYKDGVITFFANNKKGNALFAATDAAGNIIWSWHIWFPSAEVGSLSTKSGDQIMTFNLGAMNAKAGDVSSYGLLYQWGRKDPFPGAPRANNGDISMIGVEVYDIDGKTVKIGKTYATGSEIESSGLTHLQYAIANPTVVISNAYQYTDQNNRSWLCKAELNDALWGNPKGNERTEGEYTVVGSKSYYDPCPKGWRVPPVRVFQHLTATGGMAWATGTTDNLVWGDLGGETTVLVADIDKDGKISINGDWKLGWHFYMNKAGGNYSYFPATTRYDGGAALLMGSMVGDWGNYWINVSDSGTGMAQAMAFGLHDYGSANYSITVSPLATGSQADAYAVRCIKE